MMDEAPTEDPVVIRDHISGRMTVVMISGVTMLGLVLLAFGNREGWKLLIVAAAWTFFAFLWSRHRIIVDDTTFEERSRFGSESVALVDIISVEMEEVGILPAHGGNAMLVIRSTSAPPIYIGRARFGPSRYQSRVARAIRDRARLVGNEIELSFELRHY